MERYRCELRSNACESRPPRCRAVRGALVGGFLMRQRPAKLTAWRGGCAQKTSDATGGNVYDHLAAVVGKVRSAQTRLPSAPAPPSQRLPETISGHVWGRRTPRQHVCTDADVHSHGTMTPGSPQAHWSGILF